MTLSELVRAANAAGLSDVVHIHEHRGAPSALTISHLPHGPTIFFSLHNNLIFDDFTTPLGQRVKRILQHLFPPRDAHMKAGNRTITSKRLPDDSIEVRHHIHARTGFDQPELSEVGPRMTMRAFRIMNSTLETQDGDIEWQMTHYTRTSRKKTVL
ncbi:unnamed protein product [Clonostachys byssicola]|uniref:U3 small nucleolar ribonucleoprotein protein IMP4 n=1 Tax=Clonostachys byssicola TaxID=160290 RepID=A0A9N9UCQ8_9HYPO|nr:unnamed protein product [Clonostachys byssicola]